ncbi:MAG TPA: hypothetical protein VM487_15855 [Phycisphaerae bacterium]|nr:hypothetical protein [Phycisphaerae bacterium]
MEADRQTQGEGYVWDTLRRIAGELDRLSIPYAVADGIALQHFGLQRSTQDVDVLVEADGLAQLLQRLVGRGYLRKAPESRHLRDDVTRIRIEFLVAGEYPGDGQPKPVRFPRPQDVGELSADGIRFVNLKTLIELKLASAKSAAHRIKDRADVLELIHLLGLAADFAEQLDPYVREEFRELAVLPPPSEQD